ncbi:three-Cys-motif partner protein TcmP [Desulfosudis oleivorans]|uniref:Three-Cys-motif partner protein TcmP n=1 Tax=Desulfosudis oleivorans (strain DSM 6200 / JCM 39069 / Hxd3) TaxID=96561 RepID=A8ZS71_DESOH|nr:three-Cys-motif partner protein TcmP [Desulfosudis oleivorans]ABW66089.1 hypothetical protein Dole_0279 [Desulfosudis oleivorans Hxd3]
MGTCTAKDTNPEYWSDYSNLQHVKHKIIQNYLNGWFPKLGRWSGRICYFDTHAGRGRHKGGQEGSPLVALGCILNHKHRESHLSGCEIKMFFIEADDQNCCALQNEINRLGPLPKQVQVHTITENCFDTLQSILEHLNESGNSLAPAFIFVDPYGFKVPGAVLRKLMAFDRVELFVNVIWRELSMAIAQGETQPGMANTLNEIFEGEQWHGLVGMAFDEQANACINLIRKNTGAKWATHIRMLGPNGATRYMLMHLTNHDSGRNLMKDCVWKACPENGYYARAKDDPKQQFLIRPEPDLKPLEDWVIKILSSGPTKWKDLLEQNLSEIWRDTHLNKVIKQCRKSGRIGARNYEGRFALTNNPELFIYKRGFFQ